MFDNLCKSWPRESQQCINRLKNKQTSYRVLNTVLIKILYERCGSWPQKCYGGGYSTGWLRHFIATRRYEFFNFRSAEARSGPFNCEQIKKYHIINQIQITNTNIKRKKLKVERLQKKESIFSKISQFSLSTSFTDSTFVERFCWA